MRLLGHRNAGWSSCGQHAATRQITCRQRTCDLLTSEQCRGQSSCRVRGAANWVETAGSALLACLLQFTIASVKNRVVPNSLDGMQGCPLRTHAHIKGVHSHGCANSRRTGRLVPTCGAAVQCKLKHTRLGGQAAHGKVVQRTHEHACSLHATTPAALTSSCTHDCTCHDEHRIGCGHAHVVYSEEA